MIILFGYVESFVTVITDIEIPADKFALGRLLEEYPDVKIELVRVIPLRDGIIPLFWIEGVEPADVKTTLRADPMTEEITLLTEAESRYLFEIRWSSDINSLIGAMIENRADVLIAEGTVDRWSFRLQFANRSMLADFREDCQASDIKIELKALYNPTIPGESPNEEELSPEQYEVLATAHENGYWRIPRGVEQGEIADRVGISPNAASQRMRRGLDTVVSRVVADES